MYTGRKSDGTTRCYQNTCTAVGGTSQSRVGWAIGQPQGPAWMRGLQAKVLWAGAGTPEEASLTTSLSLRGGLQNGPNFFISRSPELLDAGLVRHLTRSTPLAGTASAKEGWTARSVSILSGRGPLSADQTHWQGLPSSVHFSSWAAMQNSPFVPVCRQGARSPFRGGHSFCPLKCHPLCQLWGS